MWYLILLTPLLQFLVGRLHLPVMLQNKTAALRIFWFHGNELEQSKIMIIFRKRALITIWYLVPWRHAEEQSAGLFSWPMNDKSISDIHPMI